MSKILQTAVSVGVFASAFVAAIHLLPVLLDNETRVTKKEESTVITGEIKKHVEPLSVTPKAVTPVKKEVDLAKKVDRQLNCLTRNIYHEAASEPFEGKVAVAQVTLNRSQHSKFPNDICDVVYQKTTTPEKAWCEFSWYCDPGYKSKPLHPASWKEAKEVARKVLIDGYRLPDLKEALFFHADYVNPRWEREQVAKIGRHIFYK